jgi:hypothetical protein
MLSWSKTGALWMIGRSKRHGRNPFGSDGISFGILADTMRKTKVGPSKFGRTVCSRPTQGESP